MSDQERTLQFGKYTVEASSWDKTLFPDADLRKGDLIEYFCNISDTILPHLKGRPLSFQRLPDGVDQDGFIQKNTPDHFPDWIRTATLETQDGSVTHTLAENKATLAYLADQACLAIHRSLATADAPDHPLELVIDLDPPGDDFAAVQQAAKWTREALEARDLPAHIMLTGSSGIHVVVPLDGSTPFDQVREYAGKLTKALAEEHADELTTEQRKDKRRGRVFLDINRNARGQTSVAPYSPRAVAEAAVACPVSWEQALAKGTGPRELTLKHIEDHLREHGDVWKDIRRHAVDLASHME
ncbi:MAG: non-homologous end-joining DNA ligase [Akkermansiaceae bacterium]|nr:non-homologous end-joining DNA ligase [Akkermansiaceae bacterium]